MALVYEIIEGIATVNHETLNADITAAVGNVYTGHSTNSRDSIPVLSLHFTEQSTPQQRSTGRSIALAHNPAILSEGQQISAAQTISREQIMTYLRAQLTSANPNTATVKAQVQTYIDSHPKLQTALTNIATLYGYDTGTNVGYLRAALILIALMS